MQGKGRKMPVGGPDQLKEKLRRSAFKTSLLATIIISLVFGWLFVFAVTDYTPIKLTDAALICFLCLIIYAAIQVEAWNILKKSERKLKQVSDQKSDPNFIRNSGQQTTQDCEDYAESQPVTEKKPAAWKILAYTVVLLLIPVMVLYGMDYIRFHGSLQGSLEAKNEEGSVIGTQTWTFDPDTGTLTITGTGEMPDFGSGGLGDVPWNDHEDEIIRIVIGNGITRVGDLTFNLRNTIIEAELPDTLQTIGSYAFSDTCLTSAELPEGVTEIGYCAFAGCSLLKKVVLPDSLKMIAEGAFRNCTQLSDITIPDSLEEVGERAFTGCEALEDENGFLVVDHVLYGYYGEEKDITVPEGVTEIGSYALSESEITGVELPDSLLKIKNYAFESCQNLESVKTSSALTEIGDHAFGNCGALKQINLPVSLTEIGTGAFENDAALTGVELDLQMNCSISNDAFEGCSGLMDENGFAISGGILYAYNGAKAKISIPETVTVIGTSVFYLNADIQKVLLPESVTKISDSAFCGAYNLEEINIPDSVTEIGDSAFTGCQSLTELTLGKNVKSIGPSAFQNSSLTSVTFNEGLKEIPDYGFCMCRSLTEVSIPASVKRIGKQSFAADTALKKIVIPATAEISADAFEMCDENLEIVRK